MLNPSLWKKKLLSMNFLIEPVHKKISSFSFLSLEETQAFAKNIASKNYTLSVVLPEDNAPPEGVYGFLTDRKAMSGVLADDTVDVRFIELQAMLRPDLKLSMPVAVFSLSPLHKMCFGFVINGPFTTFLNADKASFLSVAGTDERQFDALSSVKKQLIKSFFQLYFSLEEYEPVLVWKTRHEKSNTRVTALEIGFHRTESPEIDREFYTRTPPKNMPFLVACKKRLLERVSKETAGGWIKDDIAKKEFVEKITVFCKTIGLVGQQ